MEESGSDDDESDPKQPSMQQSQAPPANKTKKAMPMVGPSADSDDEDQPKQTLAHGRDKLGMFKHHKEYTQLRNRINEQENEHQDLFKSVMNKLQDKNFLEESMQTTMVVGLTPSSESPMGISENDAKCIVERLS